MLTGRFNSARVWLAFLLLSLAWGSSYLFIRIGIRELSPIALVALRILIGAITIAVIATARHQVLRLPRRQMAFATVVATVNTAVPFLLISWGEVTVPSGLASVLNSTVPIFSVLIAGAALHDEPITVPRVSGVAIGFGGVLLLLSRDLGHGAIHWSNVAGQGAIVLASLCYALSAVFTRRTLRHVPSLTVATWTLWIAAGETCLLSLLFSRPPIASLHWSTVFAVLWLGVVGSALGYVLYFFIIQSWGASRATLVTFVIPVVGLTLGALFLREALDWRILIGSSLVVLGVVLASLLTPPVRVDAQTGSGASGVAHAASSGSARQSVSSSTER